jgi:hypothetical protein
MRSAQTGLFIIAAIVAIVIGFIITLVEVWMLLYKNKVVSCGKDAYQKCADLKTCKTWLSWILKIINAFFLAMAVFYSRKTKTYFTNLAADACSDSAYNALLNDFASQVQNLVYSKNLKALMSFFAALLAELVKYILKKRSKNNKNNKVGEVQNIKPAPGPSPGGKPVNPSPGGQPIHPSLGGQPMGGYPGAQPMGMRPGPQHPI